MFFLFNYASLGLVLRKSFLQTLFGNLKAFVLILLVGDGCLDLLNIPVFRSGLSVYKYNGTATLCTGGLGNE